MDVIYVHLKRKLYIKILQLIYAHTSQTSNVFVFSFCTYEYMNLYFMAFLQELGILKKNNAKILNL